MLCSRQLQAHARSAEGWTEAMVSRINFNMYRDGARNHHRQQASIEQATNVVRIGAQRTARNSRARNHPVAIDTPAGMSPAQMMEADSVRLVAIGYLRTQRGGRIWWDDFHKRVHRLGRIT